MVKYLEATPQWRLELSICMWSFQSTLKICIARIFFKIQMFSLTLQIGMARPAARRLLDVIKKKRRKSMVAKLLPKAASTLSKGFNVGGGGGGTLGRKKNADQPSNVSINFEEYYCHRIKVHF